MASDVARLARFVTLANKQDPQREDLPLSEEMNAAMARMLSAADDGYLLDHVGSPLAAPLTSESLFAPTAALLNSKHTRVKQDARIVPVPGSQPPPLLSREDYPCSAEPFAVRLKARWLKRHAQVAASRGQQIAALSTWTEASETLADTNCEGNFREIDNELVLDNFFSYDASIHTAAVAVQYVYKKRFKLRTRSAIKISTAYRCFIAYKKYQALLRLRNTSATLIQVQFRAHRRRLNARAKGIQRWYHALKLSWVGWLARKQKAASVALQAWWRCKRIRRKYLDERAVCNAAATTMQRHTRGYLGREGQKGLNLVRRFRHYRTVNRYIRGKLARLAVARLWDYNDSCQAQRRQQEAECMQFARIVTAKLEFEAYNVSKAGLHHVRQLGKRLKAADDRVRATIDEQEFQGLKHFLKSSFDRFDPHGTGQLDHKQLKQLLRALKLPSKAAAEVQPPLQLGELVAWIRGSEYRQTVLENIRRRKYTAYQQRVRAVLRRRCSDNAATFAQSTFREGYRAGMYECCACRQTFDRFRPYYWHIRDGCPTTGEPSLFYSLFSSCGGPSQRDTEITVRLLQDERKYIENALARTYYQVSSQLCNKHVLAWRFKSVLSGLTEAYKHSTLISNWQRARQVTSSDDAASWLEVVAAQLVEDMQVDDSGYVPTVACESASEALGAELPGECSEVEHVPTSVVHKWIHGAISHEFSDWDELCERIALLRLRVMLLSRAACEASVLAAFEFRNLRQATPSARHCDDAEYNRNYLRALFANRFDVERVRRRLREINEEWELAAYGVQRRRWRWLPAAHSLRLFGAARVAPEQCVEVPLLLLTGSPREHHPQVYMRVKRVLGVAALHPDWQHEHEHTTLLHTVRPNWFGWNAAAAEVATRCCMRRIGQTKLRLAKSLLQDADGQDSDSHTRLAELVCAEQHWKAAGILDELEEEAHSRARRLLHTAATKHCVSMEKARLQAFRTILEDSAQHCIAKALDRDSDGWVSLAEASVLAASAASAASAALLPFGREQLYRRFPAALSSRRIAAHELLEHLNTRTLTFTMSMTAVAKAAVVARLVDDHQLRALRAMVAPIQGTSQFQRHESLQRLACEASAVQLGQLLFATPYGKLKLQLQQKREVSVADEAGDAGEESVLPQVEPQPVPAQQQNSEQATRSPLLAQLREQAIAFRETGWLPRSSELHQCCLAMAVDDSVRSATPVDGLVDVGSIEQLLLSRESVPCIAVPYVIQALGFSTQEQDSLYIDIFKRGDEMAGRCEQVPVQAIVEALERWTPKPWQVWRAQTWRAISVRPEGVRRAAASVALADKPALLDAKLARFLMGVWNGYWELPEELRLSWCV